MFVSFSGGKDSSVVSDLVMRALGRADILHIFGDTTLEFPETFQYMDQYKADHRGPHSSGQKMNSRTSFALQRIRSTQQDAAFGLYYFKTGVIGVKYRKPFRVLTKYWFLTEYAEVSL
jgi:phosphoadenosine phosphosulfate reductase